MGRCWSKGEKCYRCDDWCEDQGRSDARADRLTQYELIVLGGQTSHHETENMQESPNRDRKTGTILVEEPAA